MQNKQLILIVAGVLVFLAALYLIFGRNSSSPENTPTTAPTTEETGANNNSTGSDTPNTNNTQGEPAGTNNGAQVRIFEIEGSNFSFSTKEIRVKRGDTVSIAFKSREGYHDWTLDEFGAATSVLSPGREEVVEFVASEKGTFEYYCSVGNHRQMGMVGKLIVE